ncbi:MAG: quinone oxidoreductase [Hyphomicrobium sp.]|nr:quinone oxidoreductase [Hyphomicrobium sp.]
MVLAQRLHRVGGPEGFVFETVDPGQPGPGEVRVRHHAIGVNYIDTYQRTGLYPLAKLPAVLGMEGAGEVVALGAGVHDLEIGDRIAYGTELGGYAEERLILANRVVKLPDAISYETAAASMLRGMTVRYLFRETFAVGPETTMLFHAAAGGIGLIACQWARALGATMIGTVGSDEKADLARRHGAAHVINYRREDFVQRVMEITEGRGVDVVYDSIGKDTFPRSLACLKPKGLWVSFGNASGPVPPFSLAELKGSLFATRPSLMPYVATTDLLRANAADLFRMLASGAIVVPVHQRYPLKDVATAHRDLEARATTGSTVLIP